MSKPDPARHRDKAGKLQAPAIQTWVAEHKPADSRYERGTQGGQVSKSVVISANGDWCAFVLQHPLSANLYPSVRFPTWLNVIPKSVAVSFNIRAGSSFYHCFRIAVIE